VRALFQRWHACKGILDDLESSYRCAQQHYENPPPWLVGLPVAYDLVRKVPGLDKTALMLLGGYLRSKFPSFAEYCKDPATLTDMRTILENINDMAREHAQEGETCPSSAPLQKE
jgi:hypothetical protein